VAGSSEHGITPLGSLKGTEFLGINTFQEDSDLWSNPK
jgi:hypothetical protein